MRKLSKSLHLPYLNIISFTLFVKITLLVSGFLVISTFPFEQKIYEANFHFPDKEKSSIRSFKTWDSQHYIFLAEHSYKSGAESNRFFPLYPLFIAIVNMLTKNSIISGLLLSTVFSLGCAILLFKLTFLIFKNYEKALLSVVFLFSFPSSFYLSLIYTESLFIFLILLFFYCFEKKKISVALIAAFLLPLTRPTGIFIIFPLYYYILSVNKKRFTFPFPTFNKPLKFVIVPFYFFVLVPILGIALYFISVSILSHDPFSVIASQYKNVGWDTRNIVDPISMVKNLFSTNLTLHSFGNSLFDRVFFLFFCALLPFIYKKMSRPFFVFTICMGIVPILGSFTSYMRYILPAFPIYIILAHFFVERKLDTIKYALLFFFILLQAVFFSMHILNYWVA